MWFVKRHDETETPEVVTFTGLVTPLSLKVLRSKFLAGFASITLPATVIALALLSSTSQSTFTIFTTVGVPVNERPALSTSRGSASSHSVLAVPPIVKLNSPLPWFWIVVDAVVEPITSRLPPVYVTLPPPSTYTSAWRGEPRAAPSQSVV